MWGFCTLCVWPIRALWWHCKKTETTVILTNVSWRQPKHRNHSVQLPRTHALFSICMVPVWLGLKDRVLKSQTGVGVVLSWTSSVWKANVKLHPVLETLLSSPDPSSPTSCIYLEEMPPQFGSHKMWIKIDLQEIFCIFLRPVITFYSTPAMSLKGQHKVPRTMPFRVDVR